MESGLYGPGIWKDTVMSLGGGYCQYWWLGSLAIVGMLSGVPGRASGKIIGRLAYISGCIYEHHKHLRLIIYRRVVCPWSCSRSNRDLKTRKGDIVGDRMNYRPAV